MKFVRALVVFFSIVLLAFANWANPAFSAVKTLPVNESIQRTWLAAATGADLPEGINEQRYTPGPGQGTKSPIKQFFSGAFVKPVLLNVPRVSGSNYYLLSKFIHLGFSTTDVIFPFHQFW